VSDKGDATASITVLDTRCRMAVGTATNMNPLWIKGLGIRVPMHREFRPGWSEVTITDWVTGFPAAVGCVRGAGGTLHSIRSANVRSGRKAAVCGPRKHRL
jgi:hypothetical protein